MAVVFGTNSKGKVTVIYRNFHPSARKYRALNDRVARAVAADGRADVHVLLVYLRSIAYLSHT